MGLAIYEKEPNITWVNYKFIEQRIDAQYYKKEFVENEIKICIYRPDRAHCTAF